MGECYKYAICRPSCRIQNICLAANSCCLIIGGSLKILTLPILVWPKHSHIHPHCILDLKHFQEYGLFDPCMLPWIPFFFRRFVYHLVWRGELEYDITLAYVQWTYNRYTIHTHGLYNDLRKREKGMRRVTAETGWLKPKHRQSSADCRGGHTSLQA